MGFVYFTFFSFCAFLKQIVFLFLEGFFNFKIQQPPLPLAGTPYTVHMHVYTFAHKCIDGFFLCFIDLHVI